MWYVFLEKIHCLFRHHLIGPKCGYTPWCEMTHAFCFLQFYLVISNVLNLRNTWHQSWHGLKATKLFWYHFVFMSVSHVVSKSGSTGFPKRCGRCTLKSSGYVDLNAPFSRYVVKRANLTACHSSLLSSPERFLRVYSTKSLIVVKYSISCETIRWSWSGL